MCIRDRSINQSIVTVNIDTQMTTDTVTHTELLLVRQTDEHACMQDTNLFLRFCIVRMTYLQSTGCARKQPIREENLDILVKRASGYQEDTENGAE